MRIALLLLFALAVHGESFERGFPPVATYPPRQHRAGAQIFGGAQDRNGILYFGALRGVVSYDGAWWRTVTLPNESAAFAVAARSGPEIAVGGVDEIGWVASDPAGTLTYRSLLPHLPPAQRKLGDVRGVCATDRGFFFVAERLVIAWNGGAARVIGEVPPSTSPRRCFTANGSTYVAGSDGLHRITAEMTLVRAGFDGQQVDYVLPFDERRVLVSVRGQGLVLSDGITLTPFAAEASALLQGDVTAAGCRLPDGRLVIGTRQNGLLLLTADGTIEQRLDVAAGLPDDVLSSTFLDREGSLWLTYYGPIVRIELNTPVTLIDRRRGLRGGTRSVVRHQGRRYFSSSHGLFVADPELAATAQPIRRVDGIPSSVWKAVSVGDELLVATSEGMFVRGGDGRTTRIDGTNGLVIYDALQSTSDPDRVWLATRHRIAAVRRDGGKGWRYEGAVAEVPYARRLIEWQGALWFGSTFHGIGKITTRDGKPHLTTYGSGERSVAVIDGKIHASGDDTIWNIAADGRSLVPDPRFRHLGGTYFIAIEDAHGNLWTNSTPPLSLAKLGDGRYAREPLPLVAVDATNVQMVEAEPDGVVWFSGEQTLYRLESSRQKALTPQPAPLIRRALLGDAREVSGPLPYTFGRLRIEFAPASYSSGVVYQYRLDPDDTAWSQPTSEAFLDYTKLDSGDYTFRLRARGPSGSVSEEARWSFTVQPPWYRTRWAMLAWVLLAAAAIAAIVRIRTAALRRQAVRLRLLVEDRTDELQQANAQLEKLSFLDELTGIANRRYFQRVLVEDWRYALEHGQPLALVLFDLDRFKQINDERGHPAGDEALVQVARYLLREIRRSGEMPNRNTEIVARIGGEEFAVLLMNRTREEATLIADRLRQGITHLPAAVTASAGVASIIPTATTPSDDLIARADRALYAAKAAGRNCVRADEGAGDTSVAV